MNARKIVLPVSSHLGHDNQNYAKPSIPYVGAWATLDDYVAFETDNHFDLRLPMRYDERS